MRNGECVKRETNHESFEVRDAGSNGRAPHDFISAYLAFYLTILFTFKFLKQSLSNLMTPGYSALERACQHIRTIRTIPREPTAQRMSIL